MHNIQKSGPLTDPRFRIQGLGTGAKRETLGLPYAYLQLGRLKRNYETFNFFFLARASTALHLQHSIYPFLSLCPTSSDHG
jgi:hypothetical protein